MMFLNRYSALGLTVFLMCAGSATLAGSNTPDDIQAPRSTPQGTEPGTQVDPDLNPDAEQDTIPNEDLRSADDNDQAEDSRPTDKGGDHNDGSKQGRGVGN